MTCRDDENGVETRGCADSGMEVGARPVECPTGARHIGGVKLDQALVRNVRSCCPDAKGAAQVADTTSA
jgi:hypothetical protein